jgi:hypothetical protein
VATVVDARGAVVVVAATVVRALLVGADAVTVIDAVRGTSVDAEPVVEFALRLVVPPLVAVVVNDGVVVVVVVDVVVVVVVVVVTVHVL